MNIILGLIILIVGYFIAKFFDKYIKYKINKSTKDLTLGLFISNIFYALILTLTVILSMSKMGISTTPLTAVLTGIVFGIGTSLKSSYGNIASGVILLSLKPFKVGDSVNAGGVIGTVEYIGFVFSRLRLPNGTKIEIPNNLIMNKIIINNSDGDIRKVDFILKFNNNIDFNDVSAILESILITQDFIINDDNKKPLIKISSITDNISVLVRYWVLKKDAGNVAWDLNERIIMELNSHNIALFCENKILIEK